jgi:zinc transport system substrate-binding protein
MGHEDSGEDSQGDSHEDSHEGHDHGDLDPHFWQDPLKMADVADAVAERLSSLDLAHASTYRSNAEALRTDLTRLDEEYRAGLAHCERDTVVVSHDAFGYLSRYGLHIEPIAGLSPDAEPTPADLGRLQQLIASDGITTVFGERLVPAELSHTLAKDMGVATAVLDPIEGLTDETADEDYLSLMRANLAALKEADGCR